MKKNMMAAIVAIVVGLFGGNSFAKTTIIDDIPKRTIINDLATEKEAVQAGRNCIDLLQSECLNGTSRQCVAILPVCSRVFVKCRNSGNATKKWVAEQIRIAMNSTASKADLDALRQEMNRKFRSLQRQIDKLSREIKVERERNDVQDKKLDGQQVQINEHETKLTVLNSEVELHDGRIGDLEEGEKVQDKAIASLQDFIPHAGLKAGLLSCSKEICGVGGAAEILIGVARTVHMPLSFGIGYSFDGSVMWSLEGGVMFTVVKGFSLGLSALFVKETFGDSGDVVIAGMATGRYTWDSGFFLEGGIGGGGEGKMVQTDTLASGDKVMDRKFAGGVNGKLMIGFTFGQKHHAAAAKRNIVRRVNSEEESATETAEDAGESDDPLAKFDKY